MSDSPTISSQEPELTRQMRFKRAAAEHNFPLGEVLRIGGHYCSAIQHNDQLFISGQIPRVGAEVVVTGRVGEQVTLVQAQRAAQICCLRVLCLLEQSLGTLDTVKQVLKLTVFVQSGHDFTQQSEVADAASDLLHDVLGDAGVHARTSVGVYQLPKNAAVELDLLVAVQSGAAI